MSRTALFGSTLSVVWIACSCSGNGEWNPVSTSSAASPIVGGEPADPSEYPSTVALTDPGGEPFCTGTLVSTKTVVTAAHCLEATSTSQIRIVYGYAHPDSAPSSARLPVSKAVAHPNYNPGAPDDADGLAHSNDIGVVVLKAPIDNAVFTPILPAAQVESVLYPNRDTYLAGYGVYQMPYTGGDLYKAVTPHIKHIQWEMLAGKPGEPDTCNGDSGGPAFVLIGCEYWLVGVTSRAWKKSTKLCGDGGIYTIASEYTSFIEQSSGETLPPGTGSGGGQTGPICEDGGGSGWDAAMADALPDVDSKCFPATSACNPLTGYGCNAAQGKFCMLDGDGVPACLIAGSSGPGQLCDDSGKTCIPGYTCGSSIRCQALCCSDADCPQGGTCTPLGTVNGSLGTCPVTTPEAGSGGAAGAGGATPEGGVDGSSSQGGAGAAQDGGTPAQAADEAQDDGGCGCRTASDGPVGLGSLAWAALAAAGLVARRRLAAR